MDGGFAFRSVEFDDGSMMMPSLPPSAEMRNNDNPRRDRPIMPNNRVVDGRDGLMIKMQGGIETRTKVEEYQGILAGDAAQALRR